MKSLHYELENLSWQMEFFSLSISLKNVCNHIWSILQVSSLEIAHSKCRKRISTVALPSSLCGQLLATTEQIRPTANCLSMLYWPSIVLWNSMTKQLLCQTLSSLSFLSVFSTPSMNELGDYWSSSSVLYNLGRYKTAAAVAVKT